MHLREADALGDLALSHPPVEFEGDDRLLSERQGIDCSLQRDAVKGGLVLPVIASQELQRGRVAVFSSGLYGGKGTTVTLEPSLSCLEVWNPAWSQIMTA